MLHKQCTGVMCVLRLCCVNQFFTDARCAYGRHSPPPCVVRTSTNKLSAKTTAFVHLGFSHDERLLCRYMGVLLTSGAAILLRDYCGIWDLLLRFPRRW